MTMALPYRQKTMLKRGKKEGEKEEGEKEEQRRRRGEEGDKKKRRRGEQGRETDDDRRRREGRIEGQFRNEQLGVLYLDKCDVTCGLFCGQEDRTTQGTSHSQW